MAVYKRTRPNAKGELRWVAPYRDQHGKRHNKTFTTKRAAEAWLLRARGEVRDGMHTPEANSITVAQAIEIWLDRGEREGLERHTLLNYRTVARLHIEPLVGGLKLAQLTAPRTVEYRDELLQTRSRRTAQEALSYFKMIVREMQRRGLVAHNAAEPVRIATRSRDRKLLAIGRDVPSKEEVRMLLDASPARWRPLLLTAVLTGMRMSELRGLTWECVDLDSGTIEVCQKADRWTALGSPKSAAGRRTIPMVEELAGCLREWRLACPRCGDRYTPTAAAQRLAPIVKRSFNTVRTRLYHLRHDEAAVLAHYLGAAAPPPPPAPPPGRLWLVFPTLGGEVLQPSNLDANYWRPLQIGLGLVNSSGGAKYGFHKLRHFFASWALEQQFEPKRLQQILGHSSIQLTFDTYGHWFPKPLDDRARMSAGARALLVGK